MGSFPLGGKVMRQSELFELRKKCGDPSALCGIKDYVFNDGPARGVRA